MACRRAQQEIERERTLMRRLILLFGLGVLIATAFLVVPAFGANGTDDMQRHARGGDL
jgi:predicted outer membrane lipoprotein